MKRATYSYITATLKFFLGAARVRQIGLLGIGLALIGLFVLSVNEAQPATAAPPSQGPPAAPSLIRGAALWPENCAPCHGTTGLGDGPTAAALQHPPTNFADKALARERTLGAMFEVTQNGRIDRLMPPWNARLTEQEMWDVTAYAQSLSVSNADIEAGTTVYAESCSDCHGEDGVADEINLTDPNLFVDVSQQVLFVSLRADTDIHAALTDLSDELLWQALDVVRTFSVEVPVLDGALRGQLRNGTTGEVLAETEVTLYAISPTGDVMQSATTMSDADGNFAFADLNTAHTVSYALESIYQDIAYISPQPAIFVPDTKEVTQDLLVYETTNDANAFTQTRFHRIMAFGDGLMSIADVHIFEATSDRAYIGETADDGQPATIRIALPENATEATSQDDAVRFDGRQYVSSRPIIPGEEMVVSVRYNVPYTGIDYRLETPLNYGVGQINIKAADQGQLIESPQLVLEGTQEFQGNRFQLLTGNGVNAGQPLILDISNLDQVEVTASPASSTAAVVPGTVGRDQTFLLWSILGLGAVALAFSLLYSGRNTTPQSQQGRLATEKQRLLALLSELEKLHQAGEVDEMVYRQLRRKNRTALRQILMQLGDGVS